MGYISDEGDFDSNLGLLDVTFNNSIYGGN